MAFNIKRILFSLLLVFIALTLFCVNSASGKTPDYWPTEGWRTSSPEQQGINSGVLANMLEKIKEQKYSLDSVTIIRNGYVVLDTYFYPFQKGEKHNLECCAKSLTGTLVGIAIDKGYIKSVDQPILEFFPGITPANLDDNKRAITLEHLLTMTTGLEFQDSFRYRWRGLLKMMKSPDWVRYILDLPMSEAPGTRFEYCNGASFLLSAIIQKTTGMRTLDFAKKHLFGPLGIEDVIWWTNPQGIDLGYDYMWLKPLDVAKIGWLFVKKGRWEDKQIISKSWVEQATKKHTDAIFFDGYGYQWWIDEDGFFVALGWAGQYIIVVPEKRLVVVFTGTMPEERQGLPISLLLHFYVLPAVESEVALPPNPKANAHLNTLVKNFQAAPEAKPVPDLPEMARLVSGRKCHAEPNPHGAGDFILRFGAKKDVAIRKYEWKGQTFLVKVGLDNVYRFTDTPYSDILLIRAAYKGNWSAEDTFTMLYHFVGDTKRGQIQYQFEGDEVTCRATSAPYGSVEWKCRLEKTSN